MKVEMIHLEHPEEIHHHLIEKVEPVEVTKSDGEAGDHRVLQGQDREAGKEESQVLLVEEQVKALIVVLIQAEEKTETQSPNLVQTAMIEVKAALEDQNVLDQDRRRENIRKSDVRIPVRSY